MFRRIVSLLAFAGALVPAATGAADLRIAASADLQHTLPPIVARFERLYPDVRVTTTYARTDSLAARIRAGAAYDVLVAADSSTAASLDAEGRLAPGSRRTFAYARVALWARRPLSRFLPKAGLVLLGATDARGVALANPRVSAIGSAAVDAATAAKQWDALKTKVIYSESDPLAADVAASTAQAALLSRGEAESPALRRAGRTWVLPDSLCPPVPHTVAAMAGRDSAATAFVGFFAVGPARDVLTKRGYVLPSRRK